MDSSRLVRGRGATLEGEESIGDEARVNEHIGPVQFNMGGIQVDADDMLQRLKVCFLQPYIPLMIILLMKPGPPKLPDS
jgi:hypothetical protein